MKLIKERSIAVVFDSVNISKDIVVEGGPLTLNFYAENQSFIPNRFLTPTTLTPKIFITDPNKIIVSGDKHKELLSCEWFENDKKIIDGSDYKIGKDNVLTVLKNSEKDFIISYKAIWYDPRKKQNIIIEDSVQFVTISLSDGNIMPTLLLNKPLNWIHNPLKEERIYTIKALVSRDKLYDGAVEWYYRPKNGIKDLYIDNTMLFYAGGQLTNELKVDSAYMNDCIITAKNLSKDNLKQYYWFFDSKGNPISTNNPEYTDITGGDVITFPNNAMKSVVPNYKVEGLTLNQLVKNGDFSDGMKGWNFLLTSGEINSDGNVVMWGGKSITVLRDFDGTSGILACRRRFKIISGSCIKAVIQVAGGSQHFVINNPSKDVWIDNTIIQNITIRDGGSFEYKFIFEDDTVENKVEVDYAAVLNLTQTFGAGNEPTKEWCDEHIQGYFEGVKSVQTPMRIKSVGENLLRFNDVKVPKVATLLNGILTYSSSQNKDSTYIYFTLPKGDYYFSFNLKGAQLTNSMLNRDEGVSILENSQAINRAFSLKKKTRCRIECYPSMANVECYFDSFSISRNSKIDYTPYTESNLYINNQLELKSVGKVKDYIEDGKLYKNVSNEGEILEETEIINLSTSGNLITYPDGTIFIEPVIKKDFIYTTYIDISNDYKVNYIESIKKGNYELDITKAIIKDNKITHPELDNGDFGTIIYNYDNSPISGKNTISYLSLEDMLDTLWLENIYTYKAKLGEDGTVTEWELVKLIDIENYEEWLSQRKESPSQLAPDGIVFGEYKADTKFLRQFPSSLYVDFIAPDRLKEGTSKVKVRAVVGTKDGILENPSRYFKITWLKRALKPGELDKVIGYGNELILDVSEKDYLTIQVEDLDILKALTDENGKYLTNEENKILVGR